MAEFSSFEVREFDTSTLTGSFQSIGTPLSEAARFVQIFNTSSVSVYIGKSGATICRLPAQSSLFLPSYPRHNTLNEGAFVFPAKTQLQAKQVTGAAAGAIIVNIIT